MPKSKTDVEALEFARRYFNRLPDDCLPIWVIYRKARHEYLGYVPVVYIECQSKYGPMTYRWFGSDLLFSHLEWTEYDWDRYDCAKVHP